MAPNTNTAMKAVIFLVVAGVPTLMLQPKHTELRYEGAELHVRKSHTELLNALENVAMAGARQSDDVRAREPAAERGNRKKMAEQAGWKKTAAATETPVVATARGRGKKVESTGDDDEASAPPRPRSDTISNDDPNLCRTWPDVRDGELVVEGGNGIWKPNSGCTIRKVQQIPGWQACLTEKNFAFIGDSLTYGLAKKLREDTPLRMHKTMFPQKKGGDCPIKFCGFYDGMDRLGDAANGHNYSFFHCSSTRNNGALVHKWILDEIAKADYVIYGGGMWDMGVMFQGGPEPFFKASLRRLEWLQGMMKPGAELIVYKLHHIHPEKECGERELCNLCNHPKKSGAYRDTLEVAAGCLGLRVLDTAPMTKSDTAAKFSHDGIHYGRQLTIAPDLLANAVCGGTPEVLPAPRKCQKEASLERWANIPEAHVGCRGIKEEKMAEMAKRGKLKQGEKDPRTK